MPASIENRAREIAEAEGIGFMRARIRAAREAFGLAQPDGVSLKDVSEAIVSGEIVMFGRLIEIATDARADPDTSILAAKVYLAESKRQGEASGVQFVDPDPDI